MLTEKQIKDNKEEYIELLKTTKREGIEDLISHLEESSFFEDPSSSRFHGNYKGGLCEHSLQVYTELFNLMVSEYNTNEYQANTMSEEEYNKYTNNINKLIIVSLLHDICKIGNYSIEMRNTKENGQWIKVPYYKTIDEEFPFGHGEKSVIMVLKYIDLSEEEMLAIRWHMGPYVEKRDWNYLEQAQVKYPLVIYTHFADLLATRKGI